MGGAIEIQQDLVNSSIHPDITQLHGGEQLSIRLGAINLSSGPEVSSFSGWLAAPFPVDGQQALAKLGSVDPYMIGHARLIRAKMGRQPGLKLAAETP